MAQGHVRFAGRLGLALVEIGDRVRAEEALRLAVDNGDLTAANDLAILLRDEDRSGEAVLVLARAADAGEPYAGANLVELHLDAGNLGAATEAAERYAHESRPDTLVALAEVRTQQSRLGEAERRPPRRELGARRGHTACGSCCCWCGGTGRVTNARSARPSGGRDRAGLHAGSFLLDDGRADEARIYLQIASESGDGTAAETLIDLDGDPTDD